MRGLAVTSYQRKRFGIVMRATREHLLSIALNVIYHCSVSGATTQPPSPSQ